MKREAAMEWGWKANRADLLRIALLAILSGLIWCAVYDRWTPADWQNPIAYLSDPAKGDVISLFAAIKAAGEGHISPVTFNQVPELGAPHIADWDDYPMTEKPIIILTGCLSRAIGVFAAANVALLLGQVLAAISFYAAARLLGGAWLWSFAGALIFAFSRYAFAQGLHHLTVAYYWHVPFCLLVAIWVIRGNGIEIGTTRFRWALLLAVIAGVQNVYYTNMFAQLVLIGGLLQGWRHSWKAVWPAVSIVAVSAGAFLLMNANTFAYHLIHGGNGGAVTRSYHWLEIYGMKLVDLVMPPPDHPFPPFADWMTAHLKEIVLSPGEYPPSAYLGLLGLAATAWLVINSWRRVAGEGRLPLEAWLVLWIILYAEVGGLDSVGGVLGVQLFRTSTRYSIFILCIVLLYAVQRLSLTKWGKTGWAYGAAILLSLIAIWDQTPPFVTSTDLEETAREVASDRQFTAKMEERLPAQAMVFQIPVMDFPESPVPNIGSYDHFRPYLYSNHLRYSFGSDKGRPEQQWQHDIAQLPFGDAVSRLESYGFSALYVNLNGFKDSGAALMKALKETDHNDMFTSDHGDLLCVLLKPSAQPVKPDNY